MSFLMESPVEDIQGMDVLRKEMELNQRHEKVLVERGKLLSRRKVRILNHENKVRHLAKNLDMARNRNNKLREEVELFEKDMQSCQKQHDANSELETLKARYWNMVTRELSTL